MLGDVTRKSKNFQIVSAKYSNHVRGIALKNKGEILVLSDFEYGLDRENEIIKSHLELI